MNWFRKIHAYINLNSESVTESNFNIIRQTQHVLGRGREKPPSIIEKLFVNGIHAIIVMVKKFQKFWTDTITWSEYKSRLLTAFCEGVSWNAWSVGNTPRQN